ncbi:MAG: hypothetical protein CBC55_09440 [Gammaproteobacteria bacterium TMED95]|nr:cobalamin biosynthesis protein CobW [Gammaproteobacteria bacterium]OUV20340.1 MAG: hypothetical protein CBC55_09440 [Gammaproteobacteria bacterium TMED95]|tara:strand:- start:1591 stop:2601 length:1011 start_codon:yes stop_codon:yes gene_type:complete
MPTKLSQIPTNVITGFLGAGKSTAILNLIQKKPSEERWAILVNEFGEVGIDGGLIDAASSPDVFIREVPGGCMCCTAGLPMQMAMNMLLARAKPDRLLIEPTGLGHPLEVLSALATEHYQQLLDLRATLTLVDARKISDTRYTDHATFNEQLAIADIIVASKADQYGATEFDQLSAYLEQKDWLSERRLEASREGELALRLLDQPRRIWQLPEPVLPSAPTSNVDESSQAEIDFPPEGFIRLSNSGSGFVSHGWIFRSDFVFDRPALAGLIKETAAERVKALIRTNKGNVGFNFSGEGVEEVMLRALPDSRLELIASEDFRLDLFEPKLLATVQTL